jgi:hypothetical protein
MGLNRLVNLSGRKEGRKENIWKENLWKEGREGRKRRKRRTMRIGRRVEETNEG